MHKSVIAIGIAMTLAGCASSKNSGQSYPYAKAADFVEYKFDHKSDIVQVPSDYETALWHGSPDKKLSGDWVVTEWRTITVMEPRIVRGEGTGEGQGEGQGGMQTVAMTVEVPIRRMDKVVYFDFDSAALKSAAKATLKALPITEADGYYIDAHADAKGTDSYNQKLSERRANAVRKWLMANGVPADQIQLAGHGEKQPVAPNNDAKGRAMNRRAVIVLQLKPGLQTAGMPEPAASDEGSAPAAVEAVQTEVTPSDVAEQSTVAR